MFCGDFGVGHYLIPLVNRGWRIEDREWIYIFFGDAVVSLILRGWNYCAIVQVFGQPALGSDLNCWVNVVVPGIDEVGSAGEDRGWKIED